MHADADTIPTLVTTAVITGAMVHRKPDVGLMIRIRKTVVHVMEVVEARTETP